MTKVLSTAKKFGIALVGVAAQIVALGVLPAEYQAWAAVVVALATALGVYRVKNTEAGEL